MTTLDTTLTDAERLGRGLAVLGAALHPWVDREMREDAPAGEDWVALYEAAESTRRGHPFRLDPRLPLLLRDGEPGEPEVTLSPLRYHYQHRAEIEAVVQGADRDAAFDTLTASVGAALAADRTLGGLCDWVEAEAPRVVDLPVEGAASLKAAVIPVVLHYSTADPLG